MGVRYSKIRRYRLDDGMIKKLEQLKDFNIVESSFIRTAINEKIERDFKKLKEKKDKFTYPF